MKKNSSHGSDIIAGFSHIGKINESFRFCNEGATVVVMFAVNHNFNNRMLLKCVMNLNAIIRCMCAWKSNSKLLCLSVAYTILAYTKELDHSNSLFTLTQYSELKIFFCVRVLSLEALLPSVRPSYDMSLLPFTVILQLVKNTSNHILYHNYLNKYSPNR